MSSKHWGSKLVVKERLASKYVDRDDWFSRKLSLNY